MRKCGDAATGGLREARARRSGSMASASDLSGTHNVATMKRPDNGPPVSRMVPFSRMKHALVLSTRGNPELRNFDMASACASPNILWDRRQPCRAARRPLSLRRSFRTNARCACVSCSIRKMCNGLPPAPRAWPARPYRPVGHGRRPGGRGCPGAPDTRGGRGGILAAARAVAGRLYRGMHGGHARIAARSPGGRPPSAMWWPPTTRTACWPSWRCA